MSVTSAAGFRAAGVTAGLKESGQRDLAVVVNDGPSFAAAGVFTSNRVKAAPVRWSQQVIEGGQVRAVVLNSGGSLACWTECPKHEVSVIASMDGFTAIRTASTIRPFTASRKTNAIHPG